MSSKKKYEPIDPLAATESLGFQTHRRGARKPWSADEDEALISLIGQMHQNTSHLDPDAVKWDVLAEQLSPDGLRKPKDLRKRWCNSLDPSLKRGRWTKEEDDMLISAYQKYEANWQRVAKEIPGRTDDQCAKRYLEVLDPKTKDRLRPWSREEDLKLIRQVKLHGTKWRTVCLDFDGRPSLTCRNRWRKIVTDVVRGTADAYVEEEVRAITSGDQALAPPAVKPMEKTITPTSAPKDENRAPPAPPLGAKPAASNIDWRYSLESTSGTPDEDLPHQLLFDNNNGGSIKNEQLVHALISYAKTHNLEITVHQHIHHHYSSQAPQDVGLNNPSIPNLNILNQIAPLLFDNLLLSPIESSSLQDTRHHELEVKRHQHFNYLPPLTEVPKLNSSSNSLPALSRREMRSPAESVRGQGHYNMTNTKDKDSLIPLARAVEMVSASENEQQRGKGRQRLLHSDRASYKRHKYEPSEEEEIEEGPDFWETMRNLTEVQQRQVSQEPVSAHHPLHYQTGNSTPQPTPQLNYPVMTQAQRTYDEDEDIEVFYDNKRDGTATSSDPSMYDSFIHGYGVIPFNPS